MKKLVSLLLFTCLCSLTSNAASVTLAWEPSPSTNVTGNKVYYGGASRTYTNSINVGTNLTCTISNLVLGGTYYFTATAYNSSAVESVYSNEAYYNVPTNYYPVITNQPTSRTVAQGSNTTFTVGASGIGILTYQWKFNNVSISGATTNFYNITNVQLANAGNYNVVVSNQYGGVTSQVAVLTVNLVPSAVINFRILSIQPSP